MNNTRIINGRTFKVTTIASEYRPTKPKMKGVRVTRLTNGKVDLTLIPASHKTLEA